MATYDNSFNPYGDNIFGNLSDYQQWMKTSLDGAGIKTPWLKVDNKMGKNTANAMNMVQSKGLMQPSVVTKAADAYDPFAAINGFGGLSNDAKNEALYNIGKMESYTPEQLKMLEGLDTSSLANATANSGWGFMDASSNDAKNEALYRIGENWGNLSEADQASAAGKLTGLDTKSLIGTDNTKTGNGSGGQWVNGLSNFEALQGVAGLGNLGMSLYGMFGENGTNAVNKKNMQLMDQQIANNKDIIKTRTERAGDIKKYFG